MSKYRIISNGKKYRIQSRSWYFPFWITCTYPMGFGEFYYEYDTKEHAQMQIDIMKYNPDDKWKVVNT